MVVPDDMVPRATLVAVAESFNALKVLERQRAATQAEMIRACLAAIRMDVSTYRCRHLDTYSKERVDQVRKNKKDQAQAFIYLEALATMLEDQSAAALSDNLTTSAPSTEGEPPCISA